MRSLFRLEVMEARVESSSRSSWRRFWPAVLRCVCWACSENQSECADGGGDAEEVAGRAIVAAVCVQSQCTQCRQ